MTNISLPQLLAKHPRAAPDEPEGDYVARMVSESKVVVLPRAAARDMRAYLKVVATADRLDVPVLQYDAPPPAPDDTGVTIIGRDTARNLQSFIATRAISEAAGKPHRIADYRAPGEGE